MDLKNKLKHTFAISLSTVLLLVPILMRAAKDCTKQICNPIGTTNIGELVGRFLQTLIPLLGVIGILMFVVGAVLWIISGGNPEKVKAGRDTIVWTLLGGIVMLGSYIALQFIFKVILGGDYSGL